MRPRPPRIAIPLVCLFALAGLPGLEAAEPPATLAAALEQQARLAASRPGDAAVHNDLGNLLVMAGAWEEAQEAYETAIRIAPEETAARFNLALLKLQRGRERGALDSLRRVLRDDPDHAWAHYQAGVLYERRGQRKRAIRHYARAVRLDPRLTRPEVNPQIVDNELVIDALLTAHRSRPALAAPRAFEDPARIAALLVAQPRPEAEAAAEGRPPAPPAAAAEPAEAAPAPPEGPAAEPEAKKPKPRRRRPKPAEEKPAEPPPPGL